MIHFSPKPAGRRFNIMVLGVCPRGHLRYVATRYIKNARHASNPKERGRPEGGGA